MSKDAQLKKMLIRSAAIIAAVCVGFLAAALSLSGYSDSVQAEQAQKRSQNNAIVSQTRDLEMSLGLENQVVQFYDSYSKIHNENFAIHRDSITNLLAILRKKHHLSNNIEVTVSPVVEGGEGSLPLKSGKMVRSTVHITLGALTDNSVYNFIYDLQHKLPGIVVISDLKLAKKQELSRAGVLSAVNQHIITPMVTGELTFTWVGIRSNTDNASLSPGGAGNAQ